MKRFAYLHARDFPSAGKALAASADAMPKSGGTDLLDLLKERLVEPDEIVNLTTIARDAKPGEIPALATLAELAADERVRSEFPALAQAAAVAATPQIRNFATLGGNLCQHTRCWYFRNRGHECFKRGDAGCAALDAAAQNRYHAIFPHERCGCAHPSNLAPALIALKARLLCVHPEGERTLEAEALYRPPKSGQIGDTVLRRGELVRAVALDPSPLARRSVYLEFRERESFDFAACSVAAAVDVAEGRVREARIVLGAVAPAPWRASKAEEALLGKPLGEAAAAAAEAAVAGAKPLAQSGWKVAIARVLVRRALEALQG